LVNYAKETKRNGTLLADDPLVRNKLAQMAVEAEVCKCIEYKALALLIDGSIPDYEAGIIKVIGSEFYQRLGYMGMEVLNHFGLLEEDSDWAALKGEISRICRSSVPDTIGAGTNEIIRNVTAVRALGLPRK
jgi:alkylation response protein AidB-like acyl-CoA dehydrogenase